MAPLRLLGLGLLLSLLLAPAAAPAAAELGAAALPPRNFHAVIVSCRSPLLPVVWLVLIPIGGVR